MAEQSQDTDVERMKPEKRLNSRGRTIGIGILLGFSLPFMYIAMNLILSTNWHAETIFDNN
jgi:hypothetical protein